ncbi:MAG: protein kinase, partial [Acidobacteria bacterium]|nr:protein kinase [Acidobacteriota bacterium]
GIVHGDVKASNVMVEPSGRAVLMDFGAGIDLLRDGDPAVTAGSPLSMAPEVLAGRPASFEGDVYGTGVLFFRLFTGRYPVAAETLEELLGRHDAAPSARWRGGDRLPRPLRRLLDAMLDRSPGERPTAGETLAALRAVEDLPRRRRRRLSLATVLASLLLALAATTTGWVLAQRSAREAEAARVDAESTTSFLSDLLLAPDIVKKGPDVRVLDVMDQARNQADTDLGDRPLLQGRILWLIGRVKASLGQGDEALEIFRDAESALATA